MRSSPQRIDKAVFPFTQGGPLMHAVAAKAVALREAALPEFRGVRRQVVRNAQALAAGLAAEGMRPVSGGTDTHLALIDLREIGVTGRGGRGALRRWRRITLNKNAIPYDPQKPTVASGIRVGTPSVTTQGMREGEMRQIAGLIAVAVRADPQTTGGGARLRATCADEVVRAGPALPGVRARRRCSRERAGRARATRRADARRSRGNRARTTTTTGRCPSCRRCRPIRGGGSSTCRSLTAVAFALVLCAASVGYFVGRRHRRRSARRPACAMVTVSFTHVHPGRSPGRTPIRPALVMPVGLVTYVVKYTLIGVIMVIGDRLGGGPGVSPMAWGIVAGRARLDRRADLVGDPSDAVASDLDDRCFDWSAPLSGELVPDGVTLRLAALSWTWRAGSTVLPQLRAPPTPGQLRLCGGSRLASCLPADIVRPVMAGQATSQRTPQATTVQPPPDRVWV